MPAPPSGRREPAWEGQVGKVWRNGREMGSEKPAVTYALSRARQCDPVIRSQRPLMGS